MVCKSIIGAACACLTVVSFSANAAIVSVDWQAAGDDLITRDTVSGIEWLDLTVTSNRSYNDISSKLGSGQEFDGWRYATLSEITDFFETFGVHPNEYANWSIAYSK